MTALDVDQFAVMSSVLKDVMGRLEWINGQLQALKAVPQTPNALEFRELMAVAVPPKGPGILGFLRARKYDITVTVSSQAGGNTAHLIDQTPTEWHSQDVPNSWIQWEIQGGVKVVVNKAIIIGRKLADYSYGVKNFQIQGANDGEEWQVIIDSETCAPRCVDWVAEVRTREQDRALGPFSMIRLVQTGNAWRPPECDPSNCLLLSYVDFGGKIGFPNLML